MTSSTDRIDRIEAMTDSRSNRGELEAISRFGTDVESRAARRKLGEWQRADRVRQQSSTGDAA